MIPSGLFSKLWRSPFLGGWALLLGILTLVFGVASADGLRPPPPQTACPRWERVAAPAFGLPPGPDASYRSEEGFEALVFGGRLYLGMEADNTLGARLWRTRRADSLPLVQADWEEVIADARGLPFGLPDVAQNDHVDSLAALGGWLYVSTANRSGAPTGFRLFRSPTGDPGSWQPADARSGGAGFGDPANENLKSLVAFDGWLCGGTWNETSGGAVWCSRDGLRWQRKSAPAFGQAGVDIVWSLAVYDGALYAAGQALGDPQNPADDRAFLFRARALDASQPVWERLYAGPPGSGRALLLGALRGWLYASTRSPEGMRVWRSRDGLSWHPAAPPGLERNRNNMDTIVDGAVVYDGALYVAVYNPRTGVQVWRTDGRGRPPRWERAAPPGLNDYRNFAAVLSVFNGSLYAWTSNPVLGQQVLRAVCR